MGNKIIYIKLKEGCKPIEYFRNSFDERKNYYYNLSSYAEDELEISKACIDSSYFLIALIHDNDKIIYSYLGTGTISHNDKGFSIKFSIKSKLNYGTAIKNICKLSELSLSDDFAKDEYVLKEESELIAKQIDFIINRPFEEKTKEQRYEKINSEDGLDDLAQRNEYCERAYNLRAPKQHRGEFQRDYERIVHSKAFRRMVDKAQVFSASKGDYYRTRMTHTQAVSQIARGIAEGLGLNMYLTEAIALGHDNNNVTVNIRQLFDHISNNKLFNVVIVFRYLFNFIIYLDIDTVFIFFFKNIDTHVSINNNCISDYFGWF